MKNTDSMLFQRIKTFFFSVKKSELAQNAFVLVAGTMIGQAIPILLQPLLRRLFTPEEFGAYSVYLSIIGILAVLSGFRYEAAIVLPKATKTSANLLFATVIINITIAFFIGLIILLFTRQVTELIDIPAEFSSYIFVIPLGIFLFSFYQNINYWLIRAKAFRASSWNKITRRSAEGITQSVTGLTGFSPGLLIGDIIGNLTNCISGIYQAIRYGFRLNMISWPRMRYALKSYSYFPKYNLLPSLMSTMAALMPVLIINKLYMDNIVGFFDLTKMVLSIPVALISATIGQVLLQRLTEQKNNSKSIKKELSSILYFLLIFSGIQIVVFLLWAPQLFDFLFGEQWTVSGEYTQILVFSFSLNFIASTFNSVFFVLDKVKLFGIWQAFYFVMISVLFFVNDLTIKEFLFVYMIIEACCYLLLAAIVIWVVKEYEKKILRQHA